MCSTASPVRLPSAVRWIPASRLWRNGGAAAEPNSPVLAVTFEYRELTLERNGENVWELVSDSRTQPELLGDRIVYLLLN